MSYWYYDDYCPPPYWRRPYYDDYVIVEEWVEEYPQSPRPKPKQDKPVIATAQVAAPSRWDHPVVQFAGSAIAVLFAAIFIIEFFKRVRRRSGAI